MLLGLTGVGKSTMMHILSGRQMYLVEDGTNDMIKVLDECIPGSVISETANSETKVANAVRIQSPNGRESWLLIDTPGFGDTAGPIDNIVNAVSIAKVVAMCSSLRLVMMVNQSDVTNQRQAAFVQLASTVSKLFADFGVASESYKRADKCGDAYWDSVKPAWAPSGVPKKDAASMLHAIQAVKPVPLHCYYMAKKARDSFTQLAGATGGGSVNELDVNSAAGAKLLTDAVCKQILSSLGGKQLEDAYERMKPSFTR